MALIRFRAAVSDGQSAIRIGGGKGDLTKITFDCYVTGEQLEEIASRYRGEELDLMMETIKLGGLADGD